ncbi:hypothetical protein AAHA92_21639 [Salvia divinorum]|uniref:Uncharacterized protein n=1 Tax=Salvia divinorum TaxID=28513 RepID=A0ABD1GL37_SALDI
MPYNRHICRPHESRLPPLSASRRVAALLRFSRLCQPQNEVSLQPHHRAEASASQPRVCLVQTPNLIVDKGPSRSYNLVFVVE